MRKMLKKIDITGYRDGKMSSFCYAHTLKMSFASAFFLFYTKKVCKIK